MSAASPGKRQMTPTSMASVDMEIVVGFILLCGVVLSLTLIVAGLGWRWFVTGRLGLDYSIAGVNLFEFLVKDIRQVTEEDFRPRLLVNLGLAALMLTPYARVLASMLYFAFGAHNWKYTVFTGFVLSVLTYSLFLR